MGDLKKLDSIRKLGFLRPIDNAYMFEFLKNRDSMYYYLNHEEINAINAQFTNNRREFGPFRKQPR